MSNQRADTIRAIESSPEVDILIVGGGINGAGLFRELSLQGINTLLIDKADFASGASSATSRMVHGGLRYLENGEFRLVSEALEERNRLLQNAPHAIAPMPTLIPVFNWITGLLNAPFKFFKLSERPTPRGALTIKLGLSFYDLLTNNGQRMPKHSFINRKDALVSYPNINDNITCLAKYYDAWVERPEQICLELLQDGHHAHPEAKAINYLALNSIDRDTVLIEDRVSGAMLEAKPKIVVNATGAWIDFANDALGENTQFMGGTKGSHIIVDYPPLRQNLKGEMFFYENDDGRICLIIPYGELTLIGTTDIRIENPDHAVCEPSEIDYLTNAVTHVFPGLAIEESHIVASFSGVRPLPASENGYTGNISRDHSCKVLKPSAKRTFPIYSLIGGKWTTFRSFSENVADQLLERLSRPRVKGTKDLAIGGGRDFPTTEKDQYRFINSLASQYSIPTERAKTLFARYGTAAQNVLSSIGQTPAPSISQKIDYSAPELEYLIENQQVESIGDLVLRRTKIAFEGKLDRESLKRISELLANAKSWDARKLEIEYKKTVDLLESKYRITLDER